MDAITIVGAGGIGCAVGYAFCAAGVRVTFVDADEQKVLGPGARRHRRWPAGSSRWFSALLGLATFRRYCSALYQVLRQRRRSFPPAGRRDPPADPEWFRR